MKKFVTAYYAKNKTQARKYAEDDLEYIAGRARNVKVKIQETAIKNKKFGFSNKKKNKYKATFINN